MDDTLIGLIERSIKENWDFNALKDNTGVALRYKDVARKIEKMHILFDACHIKHGEVIALCGSLHVNWSVVFLSIITYGARVLLIKDNASATQICEQANTHQARLLFCDDHSIDGITDRDMPQICGVVLLNDFFLTISHDAALLEACNHLNECFCKKFPANFTSRDVSYRREFPGDIALINSKGEEVSCTTLHACILRGSDVDEPFTRRIVEIVYPFFTKKGRSYSYLGA